MTQTKPTSQLSVLFLFLFAALALPVSTTPLVVANISPSGMNFSPCRSDSQCKGNRQCLSLVSRVAPSKCVDDLYCGCVPRGEGTWRCSPDGSCDINETCMPLPDFFPSDRVCVDNSQIVTLENQLTCTREEDCRRVNQTCLKFLDGSGFCVAKYSGYEPSDAAASEEPVHGETDQAGNDNIETEPLPSPIESVVQEDDPADILASPGLLADESELDELLEGSSEAFGDAETFDDQIIASAEPIFVNVLLDDENLLSDSESEIDAQADVAQAQQPQASEEPVEQSCIAVHHLKGERLKNALLYKSDVLARVLCDENESCATPGHMVIYRERAMMMRSYCELAGKCTERFLKVNGLKYERGKRVGSLSDGLSFSALAARFESKMEELVLKTAVHIGL